MKTSTLALFIIILAVGLAAGYLAGSLITQKQAAEEQACPFDIKEGLTLNIQPMYHEPGKNITISVQSNVPVRFNELSGLEVYAYTNNGSWERLNVPWGPMTCKNGRVGYRTPPIQAEPRVINITRVWDGTYYVETGENSCKVKNIESKVFKVVVTCEYNGTEITMAKEVFPGAVWAAEKA